LIFEEKRERERERERKGHILREEKRPLGKTFSSTNE
jgi:hypothetical protein